MRNVLANILVVVVISQLRQCFIQVVHSLAELIVLLCHLKEVNFFRRIFSAGYQPANFLMTYSSDSCHVFHIRSLSPNILA